ncbi:MAG: hypothetical protein Q7T92_09715 [Lutibacter sp.]|nr:hypothetical protein [Lutibacter sp.]
MKKSIQFIMIISMGLFMNSCYYDAYPEYEDIDNGGNPVIVSYQTDIVPLWSQCVGCHSGNTPPNLNTNSYANLLNGYVVAGNADSSTLYKSLLGTGGVSLMPPGSAWTQAKITLVKDWINQGALNN